MVSYLPFPPRTIGEAAMILEYNNSRIPDLKDQIDLKSRGEIRVTETIQSEGRQWQQTVIRKCITVDNFDDWKREQLAQIELMESQNLFIEKFLDERKDEVVARNKAREKAEIEAMEAEIEAMEAKAISEIHITLARVVNIMGRSLSNDEELSFIDFARCRGWPSGMNMLVKEWQANEKVKCSPKKAPSTLWVACMARVAEMIGHNLSNEEERSFSTFVGRQSGVTHWDNVKLRVKVEEWQISLTK